MRTPTPAIAMSVTVVALADLAGSTSGATGGIGGSAPWSGCEPSADESGVAVEATGASVAGNVTRMIIYLDKPE